MSLDDVWSRGVAEAALVAVGGTTTGFTVITVAFNGRVRMHRDVSEHIARRIMTVSLEAQLGAARAGLQMGPPKPRFAKGRRSNRPGIPNDLRFEVLERDGFRCRYCGAGPAGTTLHIDHVHPVSAGGTNDIENLVTACQDCNLSKMAKLGVRVPDNVPFSPERA